MTDILKVDTSVLSPGKFPPHGAIHAEVHGNIVRYDARGPFNEELNVAYTELQKIILPIMSSKGLWGDITIFHDSAMESTLALAAYSKTLQTYVDQRLAPIATAFVIAPEVEGASMMGFRYVQIYEDAGLRFKLFQQIEKAETWIKSILAT